MDDNSIYIKPVYIFLDFDGVLHEIYSSAVIANPKRPGVRGEYRFAFHQSDLLEFTLKRHAPNARIIVSSTWRTFFETVEELRCELLSSGCNAGLVNRMVGMTEEFSGKERHVNPDVGLRLQEILAYINDHDLHDVPCIIVDDDHSGFSGMEEFSFPIVMTHGGIGFTFRDADNLRQCITEFNDLLKPRLWFLPKAQNFTRSPFALNAMPYEINDQYLCSFSQL